MLWERLWDIRESQEEMVDSFNGTEDLQMVEGGGEGGLEVMGRDGQSYSKVTY